MTTYAVMDGHGNECTTGLQEQNAHRVAQSIADAHGKSVYLYEVGSDEGAQRVDPQNTDEICQHCGTRHDDTTGEGHYSDGAVCDLYGIRR